MQRSYGNQAAILRDRGELDKALAFYRKQELICLELGNKSGLGHCYWHMGELAGLRGDRDAQKQKLQRALALFTELKMPIERDKVQAELDGLNGND